MLKQMYQKVLPADIRSKLWSLRNKNGIEEKVVLQRLTKNLETGKYNKDYKKELEYIVSNKKLTALPYEWTNEYSIDKITVYDDNMRNMKYVLRGGKRLYFPKGYSANYIKRVYMSLLIEQDVRSPHLYFNEGTECVRDKVFVDVGAAEGMISLDVVENAKEVVLFECDRKWIEALGATFEPWKSKVRIVPRYAGRETKKNMVTLDSYFSDRGTDEKYFVKLDVEGMEDDVLMGAEQLLSTSVSDLIVCTYHNENDYERLCRAAENYGFKITTSNGYMFFGYDFRHGLIRCKK